MFFFRVLPLQKNRFFGSPSFAADRIVRIRSAFFYRAEDVKPQKSACILPRLSRLYTMICPPPSKRESRFNAQLQGENAYLLTKAADRSIIVMKSQYM